jgi:hypothetical protein
MTRLTERNLIAEIRFWAERHEKLSWGWPPQAMTASFGRQNGGSLSQCHDISVARLGLRYIRNFLQGFGG